MLPFPFLVVFGAVLRREISLIKSQPVFLPWNSSGNSLIPVETLDITRSPCMDHDWINKVLVLLVWQGVPAVHCAMPSGFRAACCKRSCALWWHRKGQEQIDSRRIGRRLLKASTAVGIILWWSFGGVEKTLSTLLISFNPRESVCIMHWVAGSLVFSGSSGTLQSRLHVIGTREGHVAWNGAEVGKCLCSGS